LARVQGSPSLPAPSGRGWAARRGSGARVEGAVDGGPGDIGEVAVVVAGVGAQPGEGLGQAGADTFGDDPLGLLDHHPAGQRGRQLLVQALGLGAGAMLGDGQGGPIGEARSTTIRPGNG
jgi:hypothetical protein